MREPVPASAEDAAIDRCKLDLRAEARRFFRERIRVAGTGLALGVAFVGVGAVEVGLRAGAGFSAEYLIALLLIVLGLALIGLSLYSGMLNPVTSIRGDGAGLRFDRRWGRSLSWSWRDPRLRVDVDDLTSDPLASEEGRRSLFFEGPGPTYGRMTSATLSSLLETARANGAAVSAKQLEQAGRGGIHLVRRVRIRARPFR